jgi:hypothetical protein
MAIDAESVVAIDEMMYRPEGVGSAYGSALSDARAVQIDDVTKTPGIMFVAAMSTTEVLPITMAVPQPVTITGEMFEWWVEHFVIPDMIAKGKRVLVLDNARPHRKNVLRALLAAAGLEVWFLPKYSPWFMPMEKVFLITHMRCSARMAWTRADFTRRVTDVLHGIGEAQCRGCFRVTGWD